MRGLTKLIQVQFKVFLREPAACFFTIVFPILLLLVFGSIFGSQRDPRGGTIFGFVDVYIPALAGIIIGSLGLIGIPITNATRRENGTLRRFRATPMRPITYITADVAVNYAMCLSSCILLVVLGKLIYHIQFGGSIIYLFLGFTLGALAFFSIGYIIASVAPTARSAQVIGQFIYFPMMFLSGAAIPREFMPPTVRSVGNALPLTHCVTLLQNLWRGDPIERQLVPAAVLAAVLIVGVFAATRAFRWE
ncbi:MAG: ABC transporter permease [Planctomycetes bacterium]|nr:ABC transporter permease [Planctomycetota bacterium]